MTLRKKVGKGTKNKHVIKRDEKFLEKENWSEIKRGWIYEAAIPYTGERPLDFFILDSDCTYRGTVVGKNGEFTSGKEHFIVMGLKQRKVIIVSHEKNCSDNTMFDITVAPIYSIYKEDKLQPWYSDAITGNHLFYSYLPKEATGKESVVDLSNLITINKNMLLNNKSDASRYMIDINTKMEFCLQLGIYKKQQEVNEEDAG